MFPLSEKIMIRNSKKISVFTEEQKFLIICRKVSTMEPFLGKVRGSYIHRRCLSVNFSKCFGLKIPIFSSPILCHSQEYPILEVVSKFYTCILYFIYYMVSAYMYNIYIILSDIIYRNLPMGKCL